MSLAGKQALRPQLICQLLPDHQPTGPFLGGGSGLDKVSLCSFGACHGTCFIDHAGLELTEILYLLLLPEHWD